MRKRKEDDQFHKRKKSKDGLSPNCKECVAKYCNENKDKIKEYYEKNKDDIKAYKKEYYSNNLDKIKTSREEYYNKNRDKFKKSNKKYRNKNVDEIKAYKIKYHNENKDKNNEASMAYYYKNKSECNLKSKKYYNEHKDKINKIEAKRRKAFSKSLHLFKQIPSIDKPEMIDGYISVSCKKCEIKIFPTAGQIEHRLAAINGTIGGEANFYCSYHCKSLCPLYGFDPSRQTDPRSKAYINKTESQNVRSCQTKSIQQSQCDNDGKMHCEKCGNEIFDIDRELHHTLLISEHGEDAINASTQMLTCVDCHLEIHEKC